jgi:hypothetical protein
MARVPIRVAERDSHSAGGAGVFAGRDEQRNEKCR